MLIDAKAVDTHRHCTASAIVVPNGQGALVCPPNKLANASGQADDLPYLVVSSDLGGSPSDNSGDHPEMTGQMRKGSDW